MIEKRTATKPVALTVDSTPPKRWNKCSGMIAVFCMKSILLRNVFCSYMNFAADIHVGSKPMGIKKAQFRGLDK